MRAIKFKFKFIDPQLHFERMLSMRIVNERNIDVNIEKESCMGVGSCVAIAPQVFKIDEASLKSSFMAYAPLEVLDKKGASNQTILEAAQSCPYKAIIVEDKDSNEQIFP